MLQRIHPKSRRVHDLVSNQGDTVSAQSPYWSRNWQKSGKERFQKTATATDSEAHAETSGRCVRRISRVAENQDNRRYEKVRQRKDRIKAVFVRPAAVVIKQFTSQIFQRVIDDAPHIVQQVAEHERKEPHPVVRRGNRRHQRLNHLILDLDILPFGIPIRQPFRIERCHIIAVRRKDRVPSLVGMPDDPIVTVCRYMHDVTS